MRTDKQMDMTKLIVAFRNFAIARLITTQYKSCFHNTHTHTQYTCTYNVTPRRVYETTIAVEKQATSITYLCVRVCGLVRLRERVLALA
jgi:hypothetical protein